MVAKHTAKFVAKWWSCQPLLVPLTHALRDDLYINGFPESDTRLRGVLIGKMYTGSHLGGKGQILNTPQAITTVHIWKRQSKNTRREETNDDRHLLNQRRVKRCCASLACKNFLQLTVDESKRSKTCWNSQTKGAETFDSNWRKYVIYWPGMSYK